ncbi:VAMP5 protein, partial [Herpetotheres cachinnans]|nr:VAMP5 protein [Herpetotheres cachinnans]
SLCPHDPTVPISPHSHSPVSPMSPWSQCPCDPMSPLPMMPTLPGASVPTGVPCPQAGLARCQREAEEVTELMKQNFARALERDGRLSDLDSRAQELRTMSQTFTRSTRAVARQQRRGHRRWRLVLAAIGLGALLLLLLTISLVLWLARSPPAVVTVAVPPVTPHGGDRTPGTTGSL